jgi:hypothetical protein
MLLERAEKLPQGSGWGYELKLDGFRAVQDIRTSNGGCDRLNYVHRRQCCGSRHHRQNYAIRRRYWNRANRLSSVRNSVAPALRIAVQGPSTAEPSLDNPETFAPEPNTAAASLRSVTPVLRRSVPHYPALLRRGNPARGQQTTRKFPIQTGSTPPRCWRARH